MAKTYNTFTNVATGDVLTATNFNNVLTNIGNYRVPPMVKCTRSGNLSYTTNTDIAWNAEDYDSDGMHDNSTNNTRITPTTAGIYLVTFSVAFTFSGTSSTFSMFILKNGADAANRFYNLSRTVLHRDSLSAIIEFNGTTDYVTAKFDLASGTSLSITADPQSYFAANWIGQKT